MGQAHYKEYRRQENGRQECIEQSGTLESLNSFCIAAERISHAIRTDVGVSLGVLEDHTKGLKLAPEDYADAKNAQQHIVELLDSIRHALVTPRFEPKLLDLGALLREELEPISCLPEACDIEIDDDLFRSSLRALLQYLKSQQSEVAGREILRAATAGPDNYLLQFYFPPPRLAAGSCNQPPQTLRACAMLDHSIAAINLLFVDHVLALHGAEANVLNHDSSMRMLVVTLPRAITS